MTENTKCYALCIVMYRSITSHRLGEHIPARANECNNMTSILRRRISKHASLAIEAVFSSWSVQSGYKEMFSSIKYRVKSRASGRQPGGI
jgi:hypothetical protein